MLAQTVLRGRVVGHELDEPGEGVCCCFVALFHGGPVSFGWGEAKEVRRGFVIWEVFRGEVGRYLGDEKGCEGDGIRDKVTYSN